MCEGEEGKAAVRGVYLWLLPSLSNYSTEMIMFEVQCKAEQSGNIQEGRPPPAQEVVENISKDPVAHGVIGTVRWN